ncbi:hypothetical protein CDAR_375141 [Caerostris darwini]|uniref:Uncharacterized protein n=1 Tax=Caerostris darwini TaxID=1538125 RepID=A0AAV4RNT6_9ARAC|nr:hypothetical protein CDAR_375141 [Caerostris darwini]
MANDKDKQWTQTHLFLYRKQPRPNSDHTSIYQTRESRTSTPRCGHIDPLQKALKFKPLTSEGCFSGEGGTRYTGVGRRVGQVPAVFGVGSRPKTELIVSVGYEWHLTAVKRPGRC